MTSTFTWLDYSEYDHRKMLDVNNLIVEKTARSEHGLRGVREQHADLLFPGTPLIQKVARCFLFVPWIRKPRTQAISAEQGCRTYSQVLDRLKMGYGNYR